MPITTKSAPLAEVLDSLTTEGAAELTEHLDAGALKCYACGHRCLIKDGKRGICKVRFNEGGHLRVPAGYVERTQPVSPMSTRNECPGTHSTRGKPEL